MQVQVLVKRLYTFFIQHPLLYVILLWVSIIAITSPNLNRPLSKHHEFNPSLVLICIENWQAIGGPQNANFTPLINYQNKTDKLPGFSTDKQHQFVNVSFGNFWYLAPYYYHTLLGIQPSAASLQIYNLILLLISLLLISKISAAISNSINNDLPRLLIPLFYAISPVVTWFCTNGYVHEVAVLPFYLSALLLLHNIFLKQHISLPKLVILAILVFLGILNDWLFATFCVVTSLYAIFLSVRTKKAIWLSLIMACTIGFLAAVTTILYCYSQQMGWQQLVDVSVSRWKERGLTASISAIEIVKYLSRNYVMGFAGLLFIILAFCNKTIRTTTAKLVQNKTISFFLFFSISIGLMHQLLFVQFSYIHDYSVLKMALPISIIGCSILYNFPCKLRMIAIGCVIFSSISTYYFINRPGQSAQNGDNYNYLQVLSTQINKTVVNDEILIIKDLILMPQLMYYTKRNYKSFEDEATCKAYMAKYGFKKACFITLDNWNINSVTHISQ